MRIALIGGVERNENALSRIAAEHGHTLDYHGGHMKGRGVTDMERVVERADLIIVTTDVNSHTAVMVARKAARRFDRDLRLVRNCNPTRFRELLDGLTAKAA
ncbi:MAG: DUF2325 domain-containing protein [Polyangiales bacterium]